MANLGLGLTENLPLAQQDPFVREADELGYASIWTNESGTRDSFLVCSHWASVAPRLTTGVAVIPVLIRHPMALAMAAGTLAEQTGGKYILGLGTGSLPRYERAFGMPHYPSLGLMRDYILTVKSLLAARTVEHRGPAITMHGVRHEIKPTPPSVPIYVGALGPRMLRLSGEIADGVVLNWCSEERVAWARERIAEGAAAAGRSPSEITVAAYVRISVDDEDVGAARRSLGKQALHYALIPAYRAHFERMGFHDVMARVNTMAAEGAPEAELVDAIPPELLLHVGYYGKSDGAAAAMRRLSRSLDMPIVRIIPSIPGPGSIQAVMRACRPELVG